jgi:predicted phage baseplate assembly protein
MTTLPPLSLDDLTYEDLRLMALQRIPAASGGRWTHHAAVDPGVTLLELFAFLLEQQLFVLDQAPDALTHALLRLLGETPRGAGVARTALGLVPGTLDAALRLPAATVLQPADAAFASLAFSLRDDSLLLPVEALEVFADGRPVSDRIERGEAVPVMATRGAPGSVAVEARLRRPLAAAVAGESVALALVLEGAGVPPEWHIDAADAPPPGPLALDWATPAAGGRIENWRDGTGGLRRSGLVTFALPAGAVGADRLRLTLSTTAAAHAEPPRLAKLALGAAIAEHRRRVEIADRDTGEPGHDRLRAELMAAVARLLPISSQTLDLPAGVMPAVEASLALGLADRDGRFHAWAQVPDTTSAAPDDRVYAFDRALGRLAFGDGYAGRPPAPATNAALSVDVGGGSEGNHAAGMAWRLADPAAPPVTLVSLAPAEGGAEPETLDAARARVAAGLARRHRAVTAEDYVELVATAPGLGPHRADVVEGLDPSFPCLHIADSLTVFVVPRTGSAEPAPSADDGALQAIRARLDAARMLTTRVFVRRPAIRPVALALEISTPVAEPGPLAVLVRPVLSDYLHPALGGPSGTGWPLGRALRPSELLRVADAALPPDTRVERVGIRLSDTAGPVEDCAEVGIGPTDLVRLARLAVRVRRGAAVEVAL